MRVNKKLTIKKFIAIVGLTILTILGYLYVMFWGLISTGNLMTAWIMGIIYVVAIVLFCIGSMLWKRLTRRA